MWKPYLQVLAKQAKQALHVLDRFHITQHLNEALDEVRRAESSRLRAAGTFCPAHFVQRLIQVRSEEHTSELQSHLNLVCRLLLEKKKTHKNNIKNETNM